MGHRFWTVNSKATTRACTVPEFNIPVFRIVPFTQGDTTNSAIPSVTQPLPSVESKKTTMSPDASPRTPGWTGFIFFLNAQGLNSDDKKLYMYILLSL